MRAVRGCRGGDGAAGRADGVNVGRASARPGRAEARPTFPQPPKIADGIIFVNFQSSPEPTSYEDKRGASNSKAKTSNFMLEESEQKERRK